MRGRKPKPPGEAVGHRRHPEAVVIGGRADLAELCEPPDELCKDAAVFWRTYVPHLVAVSLVDRVDIPGLMMLSTSFARWQQASRVVNADGLFEATSRGSIKRHAALRIENEARDSFLRQCEHFGLTPLGRIRIGVAELGRQSLAAELERSLGPMRLTVADVEGDGDDVTPAA